MQDRVVEHPQRYRMVKVPGTDDIFDFIPVPGEVTESGTPLNKASLLSDPTAAAVRALIDGASTPDTPNDATSLLAQAVSAGAKIQTGTYVGTGTYGASNPCSLTFDFEPKLVIVSHEFIQLAFEVPYYNDFFGKALYRMIIFPDTSRIQMYPNAMTNITHSGNSVSWWNGADVKYQLNTEANNYFWAAIG